MQIPDRPAEGLFEMLANGTEYEVETVDQPAQEVRRAYASVLATWLYGEESKHSHRREIDALTARAEQAERDAARFHAAWHSARLRAQREASHSRLFRISRNGWKRRAEQTEAVIERAQKLATRWAVLRTHGGAAYELREALDEKPAETTPLVHQNTKPQASHSASADEPSTSNSPPPDPPTEGTMTAETVPNVAPLCGIQWGICPDHGPTLTSSGGISWCHFPECGRRWNYDRLDQPCAELATHRITDRYGGSITSCSVHAAEATQWLEGAVIDALSAPPET